jgi:hypothetical protein
MNRIPNYSCSRLTLKIDEPGSGFNDRHDSALFFKIALTKIILEKQIKCKADDDWH